MSERQNYFELLGLPRKFELVENDLVARYHERSKLFHPDRHVKADGPTRVKNALATSELNQAMRTLRDPVARAEYLLKLEGIEIAQEGAGQSAKVPPAFLMEIMELREGLMEARMAGDEEAVDALGSDVRARAEQAMATVSSGFAKLDGGDRNSLQTIGDSLVALRYYRRFLDELEAHEEKRHDGAEA